MQALEINSTVTLRDGRNYTVVATQPMPLSAADMHRRGWEPMAYTLKGKRGATLLAYRSHRTAEVVEIFRG